MSTRVEVSRRGFLSMTAAAGGGMLIAIALPPWARRELEKRPTVPEGAESYQFNAFLTIDTAGCISIRVPVPEMGQGVRTALAMLVADELDADWRQVEVIQADAADDLGPLARAAGSHAVRGYWLPLREAGAAARQALVMAAAHRWGVSPSSCETQESMVRQLGSRRRLGYGELATDAAALPLLDAPALKNPVAFRLIGRPTAHVDVPAIVRGSIRFGLDTRVPGMLRAVVARSPVYGGRLVAVDDAAARAMPGVQAVVRIPATGAEGRPGVSEGVAIVASSTWGALRARDALRLEWEPGPNADESTDLLHEQCRSLLAASGTAFRAEGDMDGALRTAERVIEAEYHVPFLTHAPMEPMNCVVHVLPDRCEIWAPTQVPGNVRRAVADELDLPPEAVQVHVMRMGGGFGRRLSVDFVLEALPIARAVRAPVQVVWTREDDMRHGFLRPFSYHRLAGALDAGHGLTGWLHRQAGTSRYAFRSGVDVAHSEFRGATWPAAFVASHRLEYALAQSNLPRGPLRAPGYNSLTFPVESFLDEIAFAVGRDPLEFRLTLLGSEPRELPYEPEDDPVLRTDRLRRVLITAAEAAGWGSRRSEERGLGIAATVTFGSYLAHVVEASVDRASGRIRVHRVTSAIDCGRAVNPNGVRAQVEGGIIDGLAAALHGEITVEGGRIRESNFHDFPLLRITEAPEMDVHIVPSEEPPTGAGEPPYPPVSAALANAVFAASGVRLRELPFRPDRVRRALASERA